MSAWRKPLADNGSFTVSRVLQWRAYLPNLVVKNQKQMEQTMKASVPTRLCAIVASLLLTLTACGGSDDGPPLGSSPDSRPFFLGFTPWPYEASLNAQAITYQRINDHGDMVKHHFAAGIPWQAAFDGSAYPSEVEAEIQGRLDNTPAGHQVFLAIDSLNPLRTALADDWGSSPNMARSGVWATRSWNDPEVIQAYLNFAIDLIERFDPTHFEYGTEMSELIVNDLSAYDDYLAFAEAIEDALSSRFPTLQLMVSVALKSPGSTAMQAISTHLNRALPFVDVLGVSVYPYAFFSHASKGNPSNLPSNWLGQTQALSGGKPLAISETGWIAEDLSIPAFSLNVESGPDEQAQYLRVLLDEAEDLDARFIIWWTHTDFDTLWRDTLGEDPLAAIWRDIGLYNELQQARPALAVWDAALAKPVR